MAAVAAAALGCDEAHELRGADNAVDAADGGEAGQGSESGTGGDEAGSGGTRDTSTAGMSGAGGRPAVAGRTGGSAGTGAAGRGGRGGAGAGGAGEAGTVGAAAGSGGSGGNAGGKAGSSGGSKRCGTRGGVQCGADQFCNFEPDKDCGATDRGGMCEVKPQICTAIYAPVCGCDDKTYSSNCNAHGAGVSVKHDGECEAGGSSSNGKTCGGIAALTCSAGQFCNYEKAAGGQGCDGKIADAAGVCEAAPKGCTRESMPVCGCDRRSYSNRCTAHAEGASVLHDGACTEVDCKALGGRVSFGTGPAAMCDANETEHTWVTNSDGSLPIEGAVCCLR